MTHGLLPVLVNRNWRMVLLMPLSPEPSVSLSPLDLHSGAGPLCVVVAGGDVGTAEKVGGGETTVTVDGGAVAVAEPAQPAAVSAASSPVAARPMRIPFFGTGPPLGSGTGTRHDGLDQQLRTARRGTGAALRAGAGQR